MRYQQLQLFTRDTTAALRDRTKARNYSPEKDEFRRDHTRRRQWWLPRRYAWKRCRSQGCSRECGELGLHDEADAVPPLIWPEEATCLQRPSPAMLSRAVPADHAVSAGGEQLPGRSFPSSQVASPGRMETVACPAPAHQADTPARTDPAQAKDAAQARAGAEPERQTETGRQAEVDPQAEVRPQVAAGQQVAT
ncbi:hypothetical protein, partial [Paractinoplanes tereljensis]|uniref:hypothetical protein n=1 Tax=Paractinoplanes tereljensis TaxID=571912 RepID=UPI001942EBAE